MQQTYLAIYPFICNFSTNIFELHTRNFYSTLDLVAFFRVPHEANLYPLKVGWHSGTALSYQEPEIWLVIELKPCCFQLNTDGKVIETNFSKVACKK